MSCSARRGPTTSTSCCPSFASPRWQADGEIRAYEKVGFGKVGVMRAYERGADGTWHDGLLMEMLTPELVER